MPRVPISEPRLWLPLQIESKTVHKRELLAADEERRLQALESKLTGGAARQPAALGSYCAALLRP